MVRWILPFLISAISAGAFEYPLTPEQVTPEVHCFFGAPEAMDTKNNGNIANSCYVDAGDGYIVVDTGPSFAYAASAYHQMQSIKPLPVKLVINTHVHDDHWLGNGFFTRMGVTVLGSDDFAHNADVSIPTRMQSRISPEAYEKTEPTLPTELIGNDTDKVVGNQELQLRLIKHKAHTAKDLYVYLPKIGVLFAGDLVFNDRLPSLRDGDINGWIAALEELEGRGALRVIGGHGHRSDSQATQMTHEYLSQMRDEIRSAIGSGTGIDETVKAVTMPAFANIALYESMHRANVETSYRVLEWE